MADVDILPSRGIRAAALVDGNGIAINGTSTIAQMASRGMRSICEVTPLGVAANGATLLQLASRGIRNFCPVSELGVATDASTAATLRQRGIQPMVPVSALGVALTGSATTPTLAQRGLDYFCPLNESGGATTLIDPTPLTLRALAGAFALSGEAMEPIVGYTLTAGAGAFALAGQSATLTAPTLWTPASLPNLVAWYKADAGTLNASGTAATNGQKVKEWRDQSGNNNHMIQTDEFLQPAFQASSWTGGKPAVYFATVFAERGTLMAANVQMGTASPYSAFAVCQMESDAQANGRILAYAHGVNFDYQGEGGVLLARNGSAQEIGTYRSGSVAAMAFPAYATDMRVGIVASSTQSTPYVNNVAGTTVTDGNVFGNGGWLAVGGALSPGGATPGNSLWKGKIAEIILTKAALSDTDRNSLNDYFIGKWS